MATIIIEINLDVMLNTLNIIISFLLLIKHK